MASKIIKKDTLSIKAVVTLEDDKIMIQTEDMDEAVSLAAYTTDFDGQEVSISINQSTEL